MSTKTCTKCGQTKTLEQFGKNKNGRLGRHSVCKKCRYAQSREWVIVNRDKVRKVQRKYKRIFREKNPTYCKDYYCKNRETILAGQRKNEKKKQDAWKEFLPKKPRCEICQKSLIYFSKNSKTCVNFDHHKEKTAIKQPSTWISKRYPTKENIKMFEAENFGILCINCNKNIPTKNRKEWLMRLTSYVEKYLVKLQEKANEETLRIIE